MDSREQRLSTEAEKALKTVASLIDGIAAVFASGSDADDLDTMCDYALVMSLISEAAIQARDGSVSASMAHYHEAMRRTLIEAATEEARKLIRKRLRPRGHFAGGKTVENPVMPDGPVVGSA